MAKQVSKPAALVSPAPAALAQPFVPAGPAAPAAAQLAALLKTKEVKEEEEAQARAEGQETAKGSDEVLAQAAAPAMADGAVLLAQGPAAAVVPAASTAGAATVVPAVATGISMGTLAAVGAGVLGLAAAGGGGGGDAPPPPAFTLTKSGVAVNEGEAVVFTLQTTKGSPGDKFDYVITGVSAADVVGGALTGTAVIGADGKAEIRVQLVADRATEGAETLSLTVAGKSESVTVNDTSVNPTYTLTKSAQAVDEGATTVFTLQTTNVDAGATFDYVITGVSAADVVGGALTGTAVIGADGKAEIRVQLVADRATEGAETLSLTVAGKSESVTVNDTSVDPAFNLTTAQDDFAGQNKGSAADNLYIGRVSENDSNTTYTEGDQIDGGAGNNTLRLFMEPRTTADGVEVTNIQNLDLRLTQGGDGYTSTLVMTTGWDKSLEKIDILSNKSNLAIVDQQVVSDISISDQSTGVQSSSYAFGYAAGVLDGAADNLNLSLDNVNGEDGSRVTVDVGMESMAITVADRAGAQYASDIKLRATGLDDIVVTGGRAGQAFALEAVVAAGAAFDSTGFAGDMVLSSAQITQANLGAGDDVVTVFAQAGAADAEFNLGQGDNIIDINGDLGGAVTAGNGVNTVNVNSNSPDGNVLAGGSITLGDGGNTVRIDAVHAGSVTSGSGGDTVSVRSTSEGSTIAVGSGTNSVTVSLAHAGSITGGADVDTVLVGSTAGSSTIDVGNGANTVTVTGAHAGSITGGSDADTVSVGSTATSSTINVGNGVNTVTVTGAHTGAITGGSGEDTVTVGTSMTNADVVGGSITTGDGADMVSIYGDVSDGSIITGDGADMVNVYGNVSNGTINVGEGDGNIVLVTGSVIAESPTSILFGNGADNALTVGGSLIGDDVVFGNGADNSFAIGEDVANGASITLGNGGNSGTIEGSVLTGSQISFGTGADSLTVGALGEDFDAPEISGISVATEIKMGAGNDQVTLLSQGEDSFAPDLVRSGAFLDGGTGIDTLTLRANGDTNLIERTAAQQVTIDFAAETFTVGQVVSITFTRGEETFTVSHTVSDADFVQGADTVATKVAAALAVKMGNSGDYGDHFEEAVASAGKLTITSDNPHQDFAITSNRGDVAVVQISDARITSFETLELVALDTAGQNDTTLSADFDLIDGTNTIKLDSQVERDGSEAGFGNGGYFEYTSGGVTTFELSNLKGGEAIHVSGHEGSATGREQVSTITVSPTNGDHLVGDKIVVKIAGLDVVYTVTSTDLAAATPQADAANIATSLATAIASAATTAGLTVDRDANVLTLIGQPGVDVAIEVDHVRESTQAVITALSGAVEWDVAEALGITEQTAYDPIQAGDLITITVGSQTATYTLTAEDCLRLNADAIVEHFAGELTAATGAWGVLNFTSPATASISVTRVVDLLTSGNTVLATSQEATETDDDGIDVVIDATLAAGATDTTMDLTVAGHGNFDIAITGGEDSGYTALDLKLEDSYDHTIDTGGIGIGFLPAFVKFQLAGGEVPFNVAFSDIEFAQGVVVRFESSINVFGSDVSVSNDGGTTFVPYDGTFDEWGEKNFGSGENSYGDFLFAMRTITAYSGQPGSEGVQTYVIESGIEAFGNFRDSITVTDEAGINTAGSNIVLDNVVAHTVDTSESKANFTIDQYSVRGSVLFFNSSDSDFDIQIDESVTVTTGTGDDHLITLAHSAMNGGSSINLGSGSNTLSLGWGEDANINSAELEAVGGINYSGSLTQLNILNNVELDQESTMLTMPGGVDNVEVLKVTDFESNGASDLTVLGAANNFRIESKDDFMLDESEEGGGVLTVANAAGREIAGDLSVVADDGDVNFNVGNSTLASLTVIAEVDADIYIAGNGSDAVFDLGAVSIDAGYASDLFIQNNTGTVVSIDRLLIEGNIYSYDADLEVRSNTDLDLTVGAISLNAGDADVFIKNNKLGSSIDLGQVSIAANGGSGTNELDIASNEYTSVIVAGLDIKSGDKAQLQIEGNSDSNVEVTGAVSLIACEDDAVVEIVDNKNSHEPSGPNLASQGANYTIAVGDIDLNAGSGTVVTISSNSDDTYFGELTVNVGDITAFAYEDARLSVEQNQAASIDIGAVDMRAKEDGSLVIEDNDGVLYTNSLVTPPAYEPDFAVIDIESVSMVADGDAYMGIGEQDLASVTVGDVTLSGAQAGLEIVYNGQDDQVYAYLPEDEQPVSITLGDVSVTATGEDGLARVVIGQAYTEQFDGNNNGGNANTHVYLGELSITAEGSDSNVEANLAIANNTGTAGEGQVDIEKVTTSSGRSTNFFVYNNSMTSTAAAFAGLVIGDVVLAGDQNANLSIFGNAGSDDAGPDMVMEFGNITLTADRDNNSDGKAIFEFGLSDSNTPNSANDDVDADFGNVSLSGTLAKFLIKDNTDTSAAFGHITLNGDGSSGIEAELKILGNSSSTVELGAVDIDSSDGAYMLVTDNSDSTITIGSVDIDAADQARFHVIESDATVTMGTVTIDAMHVGDYDSVSDSSTLGFHVDAGEDSQITLLGDVTITASGSSDSDVTALIQGYGEDSSIDIGNITVDADSDVHFEVLGKSFSDSDVAGVMTGNIEISSGLELVAAGEDVSSDIYFNAENLQSSTSNSKHTITLAANSSGDGEGNVYALIDDAPDLTTLTVSGTNAELYLSGDIGPVSDGQASSFTLDLSGLTGTFGSDGVDIKTYDPLGFDVENRGQDDGSYVVTSGATFDTGLRDVLVKIGTGDLVYNAQHSNFAGSDSDLRYSRINDESDWFGNEGWFSLGSELDMEPVGKVVTFTGLANDIGYWNDGSDGNTEYNFTLTLDNQLLNGTVTFNDGEDSWSLDYFDVLPTGYDLAVADNSTSLVLTLTGPADGRDFDAVISGVNKGYFSDPGVPSFDFTSAVTTPRVAPNDGQGNWASEVFKFVGDGDNILEAGDIGDIVIGGFRPNGVNGLTGNIDYLDFSALGLTQASGLIFTMDQGDGYFDDLIVDFVNQDLGSIRLVGVGEYYNNAQEFANSGSIIFA